MALDYKLAIIGAIQAALLANTDVAAGFRAGNIHDDRTTGVGRRRLAQKMPADFGSIDTEIIGGEEARTATPHFGLVGTVETACDAIVPATVIIRMTLKFAQDKLGQQTALETSVRQALHQGYPKLGLAYVRDFSIRELRTPPVGTDGITTVQWDVTVNLRLRLSELRD